MRRLNEIAAERGAMATILELSRAFEGIASMRISQIKDQVISSQAFFDELWRIYNQIRVDELFHFGRGQGMGNIINKELMILITSEGSFSGDIDQKLVDQAIKVYDKDKNDVVVVGTHGTIQLSQAGVAFARSFKLPDKDRNINVQPLMQEVQKYVSTTVYYQNYVSLTDLRVKSIKLSTAVAERGKTVAASEEVITEQDYIFEPSTYEVIDHLERSMMQITLSEVILESKLAQYASRFRAMSAAHEKADDSLVDLNMLYSRVKRYIKDERLKETVNSIRSAHA